MRRESKAKGWGTLASKGRAEKPAKGTNEQPSARQEENQKLVLSWKPRKASAS